MSFALAQLKSVSIWLNEEEEKAKALSKQVIPVMGTGIVFASVCSAASVSLLHTLTSSPVGPPMQWPYTQLFIQYLSPAVWKFPAFETFHNCILFGFHSPQFME